MKQALLLNAVDPHIGGVLIRGERGTAKSTAARSLADVLPVLDVNRGCRFGCDPKDPVHWCNECVDRFQNLRPDAEQRVTPFVNLPVSATEDRVVGTLDIEKAITDGKRYFEPGILAAVNRGILYVDEVNLLDDHVVDILLDAAAMGVNRVEREGVSFSHPSRFILVGTMNPEEGDLRPQLLDRFAFSVDVAGSRSLEERVEIMKRHLAFEKDPLLFIAEWEHEDKLLCDRILKARTRLNDVLYTSENLLAIAALTSSLQVEGHRADLVILKASVARAAWMGHDKVLPEDISVAAELALPHRLQKGPFSEADIPSDELNARIRDMVGSTADSKMSESDGSEYCEEEKKI